MVTMQNQLIQELQTIREVLKEQQQQEFITSAIKKASVDSAGIVQGSADSQKAVRDAAEKLGGLKDLTASEEAAVTTEMETSNVNRDTATETILSADLDSLGKKILSTIAKGVIGSRSATPPMADMGVEQLYNNVLSRDLLKLSGGAGAPTEAENKGDKAEREAFESYTKTANKEVSSALRRVKDLSEKTGVDTSGVLARGAIAQQGRLDPSNQEDILSADLKLVGELSRIESTLTALSSASKIY